MQFMGWKGKKDDEVNSKTERKLEIIFSSFFIFIILFPFQPLNWH
jgi:hypothetical protein